MKRQPAERSATEPYRPTPASVPPERGSARIRRLVASLAAAACLLAGGCGLTQSPSARIEGSQLVDRSAEAVRFDVAARLVNPNPEESLELRTIRYTVQLEGVGTYRGLRAAQATLAPGGEAMLELPVVVPLDRLGPGATSIDWSMTGHLLYIAPGALAETLLDAGVRRPTIRFRGSGAVSLAASELPPAPLLGPPAPGTPGAD